MRKIKEISLAFLAERVYSKDKILELYFNYVPYGGTAWGVEAASETYFGKNAIINYLQKKPGIYRVDNLILYRWDYFWFGLHSVSHFHPSYRFHVRA